ncbi:MAG: hypothetical protein KDC53_17520 [Saprospiraceae bacterium]|nr:hypothetical protein [Saprospiraceae bacterium]
MNLPVNNKRTLLVAIMITCLIPLFSQNNCEVLLQPLQGKYTGDCKKGQANGQGLAEGMDTYEGTFKKGLPHGTGTYTWANGDVYTGEFVKGMKDGKGKWTVVLPGGQTKEQTGFWSKDKYIGEHESPYKLLYKSPEVLSVRVQEHEGNTDENALYFEIQHKGRIQQNPDFTLNLTTGSLLSRTKDGTSTKVIISKFPFGFTLNYMGETIELLFYQETSWNIKLDFNK